MRFRQLIRTASGRHCTCAASTLWRLAKRRHFQCPLLTCRTAACLLLHIHAGVMLPLLTSATLLRIGAAALAIRLPFLLWLF